MARKKGRSLGLIGCGFLTASLICCGGFVGGIWAGVTGMLKSSAPYMEAMVLVETNTTLQNELGTPIEAGPFVWGNLEVNGASGNADLNWTVSGPDGSGVVYIEAHKKSGAWVYTELMAYIDSSGDVVDLLGTRMANDGEVTASSNFVSEGQHHLREGRYGEALFSFDQALGLNDEDVDAWRGRGEAAMRSGDLDRALNDLDRAAARSPEDIETHLLLGELHTLREDWEACTESYTAALLTEPEQKFAWHGRAICFEAMGETRKALAGARQACDYELDDACQMAIRLGGIPQ